MAADPSHLFTQHSRSWRENRYVYPVISRRSCGLSIGVNLNPDKTCNFDCVYCCVDRTAAPSVSYVDLNILRPELDQMLGLAATGTLFQQPPFDQTPLELRRINDVAFSGDGEPTACARFPEACQVAVDLLNHHRLPTVKIVLITNATLLHRPSVARALDFLDQHNGEIWAKLDAGTEDFYRQVDRTSVPFQRVLDNIAQAGQSRSLVIQSLFVSIAGQCPPQTEIVAYVNRLRELLAVGCRIKLVQVYTVARRPAQSTVAPLPAPALDAVAAQVRAIPLPVETYYGPA